MPATQTMAQSLAGMHKHFLTGDENFAATFLAGTLLFVANIAKRSF